MGALSVTLARLNGSSQTPSVERQMIRLRVISCQTSYPTAVGHAAMHVSVMQPPRRSETDRSHLMTTYPCCADWNLTGLFGPWLFHSYLV